LDALDEHNAGSFTKTRSTRCYGFSARAAPGCPITAGIAREGASPLPDWYVARQLRHELDAAQLQTLEKAFSTILDNNLMQARVFVHRDYHSRNPGAASPNR